MLKKKRLNQLYLVRQQNASQILYMCNLFLYNFKASFIGELILKKIVYIYINKFYLFIIYIIHFQRRQLVYQYNFILLIILVLHIIHYYGSYFQNT